MPDLVVRLRARLAGEGGFTMIVVLLAMLVLSALSIAAFQSSSGDLRAGRYSDEQKQAYAAAEAGLAWVQARMDKDPSYLANCGSGDIRTTAWDGVGADPRGPWKPVGGTSTGSFVVEAIPYDDPGSGATPTCVPGNEGSMIDPRTGTVRLRFTGRARDEVGTDKAPRRSLIATFRRKGFLDYLYFSDYETIDPPLTEIAYKVKATNPSINTWAASNCVKHFTDGRESVRYTGTFNNGGGVQQLVDANGNQVPCPEVKWSTGDTVAGPFHSNDSILVCGGPTFGSGPDDVVEVSAATQAARNAAVENPTWWVCSQPFTDPTTTGNPLMKTAAATLPMPTSNSALAAGATTYAGKTTIVLKSGGLMDVTNHTTGVTTANVAQPADGVIYVANSGACATYNPLNPDATPNTCGEVRLRGTYNKSMTIAAQSDIVIEDNVTMEAGSDAILGLIADNYVRVKHAVAAPPATYDNNANCTSVASHPSAATPNQLTIEAAILTLNHSFIVDNWACPFATAGQKQLTVKGAIAQKFRGPVSSGNQATGRGYWKDYQYDPRFKFRSPPRFLDPLQAKWNLVRLSEQRKPTG